MSAHSLIFFLTLWGTKWNAPPLWKEIGFIRVCSLLEKIYNRSTTKMHYRTSPCRYVSYYIVKDLPHWHMNVFVIASTAQPVQNSCKMSSVAEEELCQLLRKQLLKISPGIISAWARSLQNFTQRSSVGNWQFRVEIKQEGRFQLKDDIGLITGNVNLMPRKNPYVELFLKTMQYAQWRAEANNFRMTSILQYLRLNYSVVKEQGTDCGHSK